MEKKEKLKGIEYAGDDDILSQDEAIARTIIGMKKISPTDLSKMTHITDDMELKQLAVLKTIGEYYDVEMLNIFVKNMLEMKISLRREGRKEIQAMITSQMNKADGSNGFMDRIKQKLF